MSVRKLNENTRSLMRSSFIITDLNSIVDELIANALDANATDICVALNLDTYCLEVRDNGDGISSANMQHIAQRHHTSKHAANEHEMRGITCLGYKGEALASLAQISMLHIISKSHGVCHSKLIRGGKVISMQQNSDEMDSNRCPHAHGTTILVKDMFYNLKIRREQIFGAPPNMKNRSNNNSNAIFKRTADKLHGNLVKWTVAYYDRRFTLVNEQHSALHSKVVCTSKGYASPKSVLSHMIDAELMTYLHEFDSDAWSDIKCDTVRVWGVLCDVRRLYHKRNWQFLYVNKRCITSHQKRIEKTIVEFMLDLNKTLKSELDLDSVAMDSSQRVPWYTHKQNAHHQHPIYAVFIETDARNVVMEHDIKKLHVLIRNEDDVIATLKAALVKWSMMVYPSLRLMESWRDEHPQLLQPETRDWDVQDDDDTLTLTLSSGDATIETLSSKTESVPARDEHEEDEEKLIVDEDTSPSKNGAAEGGHGQHADDDDEHVRNQEIKQASPASSTATLPFYECCALSTPTRSISSSCKTATESPSPPSQLTRRKQEKLYLWSLQRKQQKRSFLETAMHDDDINHDAVNVGISPRKRQKTIVDYFDDNDGGDNGMMNENQFFPTLVHTDTQSVIASRQHSDALMRCVLPAIRNDLQGIRTKTVNGENLFDFNFPDFQQNITRAHHDDDASEEEEEQHDTGIESNHNHNHNHNRSKNSGQNLMQMIEDEVDLSKIFQQWRENFVPTAHDTIPLLNLGSCHITVSKQDLSKLELFGVGQIDKKWIITRLRQYIILIDQHAADERVRVENLTNFIMGSNGPNEYRLRACKLQTPYELQIEYEELETLKRHTEWIQRWGFQYELVRDRNNVIKVFQTPTIYGLTVSVDELRELLHDINSLSGELWTTTHVPKCIQRKLASKACRSAIKFGDKLNDKQMKHLLKSLAVCKLPFQCAHGRPTFFPIANLTEFEHV